MYAMPVKKMFGEHIVLESGSHNQGTDTESLLRGSDSGGGYQIELDAGRLLVTYNLI